MVGKNIKKFREKKGLTQEQLAESLNVTRQAVSNWENGKTQPDIEMLNKLALTLEVSVEEIIYGEQKHATHVEVRKETVQKVSREGITFGSALAMIISYVKWHSIGWAILHGILGWAYVIYYIIKY